MSHRILVCLAPELGVEFLCRCGVVLDDAQAGAHHLLRPDEAVPAVGPMTAASWRAHPVSR